MAMKRPDPADVDKWFTALTKQRTASAGFSLNRIIVSPRAVLGGNRGDPNGVCGDCVLYVGEEYAGKFGNQPTSNGFKLWRVVWDGTVLNHTATIMVPEELKGATGIKWDDGTVRVAYPVAKNDRPRIEAKDIKQWTVYDLYYKKSCSLYKWWDDLDSCKGKVAMAGIMDEEDILAALAATR